MKIGEVVRITKLKTEIQYIAPYYTKNDGNSPAISSNALLININLFPDVREMVRI